MRNVKGWFIVSVASMLAIAGGFYGIKPAEYLLLAWVALTCFIGLLLWVGVFLPDEKRAELREQAKKNNFSLRQMIIRNVVFFAIFAACGFPVWAFLYMVMAVMPHIILLQESD